MADDALAILTCPVKSFPFFYTWFLGDNGLSKVGQINLLQQPLHPDVSDEYLLVVASRGAAEPLALNEWARGADIRSLATKIVPGAGHKLHIFADTIAAGWECLVGESNWVRP
jgi:hypothetical protein